MTDFNGHSRVGEVLRRHRVEMGLTMEAVAEHLGCAVSTVSRLEHGDDMTIERLYEWADLLGETPESILSEARALVRLGVEVDMSGTAYSPAKLTEDQVREIRRAYADSDGDGAVTYAQLAEQCDVHEMTICRAVNKDTWKEVGDE